MLSRWFKFVTNRLLYPQDTSLSSHLNPATSVLVQEKGVALGHGRG